MKSRSIGAVGRAVRVVSAMSAVTLALLCSVALADEVDESNSAARQSRDDAWWTGPLLAPSGGTLPQGHALVEPYLYDAISQGRYDDEGTRRPAPHSNDFGSLTYLLYGLTDRISVGLIPRFGFESPADGRSSSQVGFGDLGVQAQYGLTQFREGSWLPTLSVVLGETLPTGKYDRLGDTPANGLGAGVFTTIFGLYGQYFWWLPNGRILRTRLDLSYSVSGRATVTDVSVYGTSAGFEGEARPGNSTLIDAAGEYSLTRNWVLACDIVYQHDSSTRVSGVGPAPSGGSNTIPVPNPGSSLPILLSSGSDRSLSLAPAIEYNFTASVGVILGAKLTVSGRNTGTAIIPVGAVNIVL